MSGSRDPTLPFFRTTLNCFSFHLNKKNPIVTQYSKEFQRTFLMRSRKHSKKTT